MWARKLSCLALTDAVVGALRTVKTLSELMSLMEAITREMGFRYYALAHHDDLRIARPGSVSIMDYPADQLIALRRATEQAAAAAPVSEGLAVDNLHFNYTVSGDQPAWRPLRAFDDGRQTFIEFPASLAVGDAPPLFIVGPSGDAELVNYRVRGRYYVVDRIFDAAELRLGTRKQQIVRITRVAEGRQARKGKRA